MPSRMSDIDDNFYAKELDQRPEIPDNDRGSLENIGTPSSNRSAPQPSQQHHHDADSSHASGELVVPEDESSNRRKSTQVEDAEASRFLELAHHWAWITIFSIFGTLTRLGLQALNSYTGQLVPALVWAQFVGCVFMGFLTEDNVLFPKDSEKYDALYFGLTVGYCGSVTTFSGWILQVFEDLANTKGYHRSRGYNVISIITQIMVTLAASLAGFRLGNHLAIFADYLHILHRVPKVRSRIVISVIILLAICFQAATILPTVLRREWRGIAAFAILLSPAGALTRWHLSRLLNSRVPRFPLGTFSANMLGCLLEAIFHLLQYRTGNGNACAALQGLQDGYCGALTTVSTLVVELCTLRRKHAYIYAVASLLLGSSLYVLVDGIDYWTHGSADGYFRRCTFS